MTMFLKSSRLSQLRQRGKSIETSISLCLSASSLATPWIKLVMAGPPSETSGLVI